MNLILSFLLSLIGFSFGVQNSSRKFHIDIEDVITRNTFYIKHKDTVCKAIPELRRATIEDPKPISKGSFTEEEFFTIAITSVSHEFSTAKTPKNIIIPSHQKYAENLLNILSIITKKFCPSESLPDDYINAAKNLFLYYRYSTKKSLGTLTKNGNDIFTQNTWAEISALLKMCSEDVIPSSSLEQSCSLIEKAQPQNSVDYVDEVIDTIWLMFSTTFAQCFLNFYPRHEWVITFAEFFISEFVEPFFSRWKNPGPMAPYFPLLFGPFDFQQAKANLQNCTETAYSMLDSAEIFEIVRPVLDKTKGISWIRKW